MRGRAAAAAVMMALVAAAPRSAAAQATPRLPVPDIGRTERTFDALQREQRRAGAAALPLPPVGSSTTAADTRPLVRLTGVVFEGAITIPAETLAPAYRPYVGKTVSQADLAAIAVAISDIYRAHGYYLSRAVVPPQDLADGRVHMRVIEGRITDLQIAGPRIDPFGIRAVLDLCLGENPSRRTTLERRLLLVNDLPGVRIADTALEEIGSGSGRFRLTVRVETWQIFTAVSLDNRGTAAAGPLQAYVSSNFNSSLRPGDTLGVNLSTVPDDPRELGFGRLFYNLPVGVDGARVGAVATYSEARPGDWRRDFGTRDRAETYDLRGSIVPLRTRDQSLWLTAFASIGNYSETDDSGEIYRDRLRTVTLSADYQMHDRLEGWNYLTMNVRQGLGVFGASRKGDDYLSRPDGDGTFTRLELYYTRYQKIDDVWSLKMSLAGQLASTALLASQEFYLGAPFGRGYYGADLSGDNAIAASLELRYDQAVQHDVLKGYQLYGYVDRTTAWNFHSDGQSLTLSLAGFGARFYLPADLQAGIEGAIPVEWHAPGPQDRDPRAFFYVSKAFKLCPGSAQMRCG
jgi:hemolysin activation/secretion protein